MSERVLLNVESDGTANVTLNRADVHNAFDSEMVHALTATLEHVAADAAVRAVVLRGAGKNFCAGADIEQMKRSATYTHDQNVEIARQSAKMFHTLYKIGKPTVVAVQGAVRGGGCGLVAACDIAIAAGNASFRLSEVKIGVIPAMISPYVIAAIGERSSRRYMLTGEIFDARQARRMGLVHEVTEEHALETTVQSMLAYLRSSGPQAMKAIKALIPVSAHAAIGGDIVEETARRIAEVRATEEAQEGLSAFLEKRQPTWAMAPARRDPK